MMWHVSPLSSLSRDGAPSSVGAAPIDDDDDDDDDAPAHNFKFWESSDEEEAAAATAAATAAAMAPRLDAVTGAVETALC